MALKEAPRRLRAHSERVIWQGKGPGVFEQEVGDLEDALVLTTLEKAVAWAQGEARSGRTPSGSPAARSR